MTRPNRRRSENHIGVLNFERCRSLPLLIRANIEVSSQILTTRPAKLFDNVTSAQSYKPTIGFTQHSRGNGPFFRSSSFCLTINTPTARSMLSVCAESSASNSRGTTC